MASRRIFELWKKWYAGVFRLSEMLATNEDPDNEVQARKEVWENEANLPLDKERMTDALLNLNVGCEMANSTAAFTRESAMLADIIAQMAVEPPIELVRDTDPQTILIVAHDDGMIPGKKAGGAAAESAGITAWLDRYSSFQGFSKSVSLYNESFVGMVKDVQEYIDKSVDFDRYEIVVMFVWTGSEGWGANWESGYRLRNVVLGGLQELSNEIRRLVPDGPGPRPRCIAALIPEFWLFGTKPEDARKLPGWDEARHQVTNMLDHRGVIWSEGRAIFRTDLELNGGSRISLEKIADVTESIVQYAALARLVGGSDAIPEDALRNMTRAQAEELARCKGRAASEAGRLKPKSKKAPAPAAPSMPSSSKDDRDPLPRNRTGASGEPAGQQTGAWTKRLAARKNVPQAMAPETPQPEASGDHEMAAEQDYDHVNYDADEDDGDNGEWYEPEDGRLEGGDWGGDDGDDGEWYEPEDGRLKGGGRGDIASDGEAEGNPRSFSCYGVWYRVDGCENLATEISTKWGRLGEGTVAARAHTLTRVSRWMSWYLRHRAATPVDDRGWVNLNQLLDDIKEMGLGPAPKYYHSAEAVLSVVASSIKRRFSGMTREGDKFPSWIRCNHGHSNKKVVAQAADSGPRTEIRFGNRTVYSGIVDENHPGIYAFCHRTHLRLVENILSRGLLRKRNCVMGCPVDPLEAGVIIPPGAIGDKGDIYVYVDVEDVTTREDTVTTVSSQGAVQHEAAIPREFILAITDLTGSWVYYQRPGAGEPMIFKWGDRPEEQKQVSVMPSAEEFGRAASELQRGGMKPRPKKLAEVFDEKGVKGKGKGKTSGGMFPGSDGAKGKGKGSHVKGWKLPPPNPDVIREQEAQRVARAAAEAQKANQGGMDIQFDSPADLREQGKGAGTAPSWESTGRSQSRPVQPAEKGTTGKGEKGSGKRSVSRTAPPGPRSATPARGEVLHPSQKSYGPEAPPPMRVRSQSRPAAPAARPVSVKKAPPAASQRAGPATAPSSANVRGQSNGADAACGQSSTRTAAPFSSVYPPVAAPAANRTRRQRSRSKSRTACVGGLLPPGPQAGGAAVRSESIEEIRREAMAREDQSARWREVIEQKMDSLMTTMQEKMARESAVIPDLPDRESASSSVGETALKKKKTSDASGEADVEYVGGQSPPLPNEAPQSPFPVSDSEAAGTPDGASSKKSLYRAYPAAYDDRSRVARVQRQLLAQGRDIEEYTLEKLYARGRDLPEGPQSVSKRCLGCRRRYPLCIACPDCDVDPSEELMEAQRAAMEEVGFVPPPALPFKLGWAVFVRLKRRARVADCRDNDKFREFCAARRYLEMRQETLKEVMEEDDESADDREASATPSFGGKVDDGAAMDCGGAEFEAGMERTGAALALLEGTAAYAAPATAAPMPEAEPTASPVPMKEDGPTDPVPPADAGEAAMSEDKSSVSGATSTSWILPRAAAESVLTMDETASVSVVEDAGGGSQDPGGQPGVE